MESDDVPATHFGRYQVLEELGAGAMGVVYLCVDPRLARPVAVKVLKESEYLTPDERDQYQQRFRQEAEAAGRLSHPDIVQIYDIGPSYLVMEFIEGRTLQALLSSDARVSVHEVARIVQRVADALEHAHRHGIVHRDIKPANIMLLPDGGVKVMDFGVARLDSSNLTAVGSVLGSVRYMAPEQMMGQRVDGRADVFSLAAVAYELLTGRAPFPGKTVTEVVSRVVHGAHVPPRDVDGRFPQGLDAVFAWAFAPEAAQRCAHALEFARSLQDTLRAVGHLEIRLGGGSAPGGLAPTRLVAATAVDARDETRVLSAEDTRALLAPRPNGAAAPAAPTLVPQPAPTAVAVKRVHAATHGVLSLESRPSPALASIDGNAVGATPLQGLTLAFGWHQVRLEAAGFEAFVFELEVGPANPLLVLSAELKPVPPAVAAFETGMSSPVRIAGELPSRPGGTQALGLSGCPEVEVVVGADGGVAQARVLRSAGAVLDQALLEAVRGWRFKPACRDGQALAVRLVVRHSFK